MLRPEQTKRNGELPKDVQTPDQLRAMVYQSLYEGLANKLAKIVRDHYRSHPFGCMFIEECDKTIVYYHDEWGPAREDQILRLEELLADKGLSVVAHGCTDDEATKVVLIEATSHQTDLVARISVDAFKYVMEQSGNQALAHEMAEMCKASYDYDECGLLFFKRWADNETKADTLLVFYNGTDDEKDEREFEEVRSLLENAGFRILATGHSNGGTSLAILAEGQPHQFELVEHLMSQAAENNGRKFSSDNDDDYDQQEFWRVPADE